MSNSKLEFTLELVTPAFIAGARSKEADTPLRYQGRPPRHRLIGTDSDGLRVPSLRGLLRFWFRAKEGLDPAPLAAREARIFGSTERGQGVRLIPAGQSKWEPEVVKTGAGSALAYLGYGPLNYVSPAEPVSSHNRFAFRDAIPVGARFSFLALGSSEQIAELKKCLILLHLFGAIGGRSRRGWGSLLVESGDLPLPLPAQIGPWAQDVLSRYVWPSPSPKPSARGTAPVYSAFWQNSRIQCLGGSYQSASEVLEAFFGQFRLSRLYQRKHPASSPPIALADHADEWATAIGGGLRKAPRRMAFGFPYKVRFHSGEEIEYTASDSSLGRTVEIHRRASPLLLKVIKLGPNRFGGIAVFFNNPFFSSPTVTIGAKLNGSAVPGNVPSPPYTAVDDFLRQPGWTPVILP